MSKTQLAAGMSKHRLKRHITPTIYLSTRFPSSSSDTGNLRILYFHYDDDDDYMMIDDHADKVQ